MMIARGDAPKAAARPARKIFATIPS